MTTFTINRKLLATELGLLSTVTAKKETIPILSSVRMDWSTSLILTASSLDITLVSEVELLAVLTPETDSFCLPLRELHRLVSLFESDDVTFARDGKRLLVQGGKSRHKLPFWEASEYPPLDTVEAEPRTVNAAIFQEAIESTAFAALVITGSGIGSGSDHKLTGLHLTLTNSNLTMVATNRLRLAMANLSMSGPDFSVIVPPNAIAPLIKLSGDGDIALCVTDNRMSAQLGPRKLITGLLNEKPLPWLEYFPPTKDYPHKAQIEREPFINALRRVLVTETESAKFVVNGIKWILSKDELLIESRGGDKGKSDDVVAIICPTLNGDSLSLGMNGPQALDWLSRSFGPVTCEFGEGVNMVRLKPVEPMAFDYEYIVNTVRLKW